MMASTGLSAGLDRLTRAANLLSAGLTFVLLLLVVTDIVGRRFLGRPLPMTFEVGGLLLVFIVFLALADAQRARVHIRVEFVARQLSPRLRSTIGLLASLLGIVVFAAITYESFGWAWRAYLVRDYVPGLIDIPKYPAQLAVPLGTALLSLQFVASAVRHFRALR